MVITIITIRAFTTSILTFFSGFGLGTIPAPVFTIFFPVVFVIALTGVVHFRNNFFKIALIGKNADKTVLACFADITCLSVYATRFANADLTIFRW